MTGLAGDKAGLLEPQWVKEMLTEQVAGQGLGPRIGTQNGQPWFGHSGLERGLPLQIPGPARLEARRRHHDQFR